MKKSTLALLGIGAVCVVAGGWYAVELQSTESIIEQSFRTQSVKKSYYILFQNQNELSAFEGRIATTVSRGISALTLADEENNLFKKHNLPIVKVNETSRDVAQYLAGKSALVEEELPVELFQTQGTYNDPLVNEQWHLQQLGSVGTCGGEEKILGIHDTGVKQHEDLLVNGVSDNNGHGTAVAGAAGAQTNNAIGIASMSEGVQIISKNAIGSIAALLDLYDQGAQVINMSYGMLGGTQCPQIFQNVINYLSSKGVQFVAAAGNISNTIPTPVAPATCDNVLSVGAIDSNLKKAQFSHEGDIYAPGVNLLTTDINGGYKKLSGTSFSSAIVAGLLAKGVDVMQHLKTNSQGLQYIDLIECNVYGNDGGSTCPLLPESTLGSKNISFSDGTNLKTIFGDTNEYVLVSIGSSDCGPCLTKGEAMNNNSQLQNLLGNNSTCGFVEIVDNAEIQTWKSKVGGYVAQKTKGWGTNITDTPSQIPWSVLSPLGQAIGLTTTSIPRMALLKRDGTYVNDDIELSEIAQYCTMCPMESGDIGDNCLADGECQSGVCEEITQGKCVSGQYGEKISCKGFTSEEQCLGFKQDVGIGSGLNSGGLVSVCAWEETVVGGTCVASCGNKIKEGTEQCDDGNTVSGDGCSATCEIEKPDTLCGEMKNNKSAYDYNNDGLLNKSDIDVMQQVILNLFTPTPGKTYDLNKDNNITTADLLLYNKTLIECFGGVCGNAIKEGSEQCDDGNDDSGDGCSNNCEIEKEAYCEIIANPNPAIEGQGVQFIAEGYAPWADTYSYTITDGSMGGGIPFESFGGFPIGIGHFAGKGPITITVNLSDKDTGEKITCSLTIPVEKAQPTCGNNIIEAPEQCDGSGCAKGQTCAAVGTKNACTCQTEIIKEPIPTTPPTRNGGSNDR